MRDQKLPIGSRMCKCPTCGLYFNSPGAFGEHRVGEIGTPARRCLTAEELVAKGWGARGRGPYWTSQPGGKRPKVCKLGAAGA